MHYFDYQSVATEARIPPDKLEELARMIRSEFPKDEMMYELHLLRACLAVRDGFVSLEDVLRAETVEMDQ